MAGNQLRGHTGNRDLRQVNKLTARHHSLFPSKDRRGQIWRIALPIMGGMMSFDTLGMVLMNSLIGAGDTKRAMWISVSWQWMFFLPLAFLLGPVLGFGLLGIWLINGFYRVGQAVNVAWQWKGRKWADIKI